MTIRHHPPEDLMLGLAAGRLPPAMALALQVHVDGCAACRSWQRRLEGIGGMLLDDGEPVAMTAGALERVMQRIAEPAPAPGSLVRSQPLPMPPGAAWPRALQRCEVTGWRWMAPGMRYAKATLPEDRARPLFLLRIAPGMSLARHTHGRLEFTQVLCGTFDDGRAVFGAGDFDLADPEVHHQPQVLPGGDCVCLAYVEDGLRYDGRLARMVGRWIGL